MAIGLAIVAGLILGFIIERGDLCFHSVLRGAMQRPPEMNLMRAYLLAMLVAIPLVQGLMALGWIEPWIPPFNWQANIGGGILFGVGMVVAATCVTGLFYKLGHGMLGTLVALVAWAIGDIVTYRGFLRPFRQSLNSSSIAVNGESATVLNGLGTIGGIVLLLVVLGGTAVYLYQSPREPRKDYWQWLPLGLAVGLFTSIAWLLAKSGGSNYTFGTSSVPSNVWGALVDGGGGGNLWVPLSLVSLIPGAFIAAYFSKTLWVRGETMSRYLQLAGGGLLMGVGAAISGGCNLGHSLVGIPLLSLGSIATTLSMGIGVFVADRVLKMVR